MLCERLVNIPTYCPFCGGASAKLRPPLAGYFASKVARWAIAPSRLAPAER